MAHVGERRGTYLVLAGKFYGNRKYRRCDNITVDLCKVTGQHLAEDRGKWRAVINTAMILRIL